MGVSKWMEGEKEPGEAVSRLPKVESNDGNKVR